MSPAAPARPRVSVVVVSYQVRDLLRACLASLRAQQGVDLETWVVDNASTDGSADMVAAEFPEARLERSVENLGFARANNLALARVTGDWLALVNPDTELPPDALATTVEVFGRWPDAGCVGLELVNPDGSHQPSCHAFPGVLNVAVEAFGAHRPLLRRGFGTATEAPIPRGGEGPVDWVAGAFMVLARDAYQRVGGLDETSFMYGEEMDWSLRAQRAGFRTVYSTRARVLHHGGASGAGSAGPLYARVLEARVKFLQRTRGAFVAAVARELMTLGSAIRWVYWRLRVAREGASASTRAREQLQRFEAALAWRRGRTP